MCIVGRFRPRGLETEHSVSHRRRIPKRSSFKCLKKSQEIIRPAVTLYVRYPLSLRTVEDLLHERGIEISYETIRYWWHRFGPIFASEISKRWIQGLKSSCWRWDLDEVFVKINGGRHSRWRAVEFDGNRD